MNGFEKKRQQEFEQVVTEQLDALYRTALRLQGNAADAEDAVQECCVRAYHNLDKLKADRSMKLWLFRILKNICIDRLRWRARVRIVSTDENPDALDLHDPWSVETPEQQYMRSSLGRLFGDAILRLPIEQRAVVVLVLIEEFSYLEAAEALQVPVGTVRSRLNRAREQLREILRSHATTGNGAVAGGHPAPGTRLVQ